MGSSERRFLSAELRDLVMLNYEVPPEILSKRVPPGTELDSFNGRTFVSIVGFRFLSMRVLGLPIPGHRNFEEVNLRFYVRRYAPEGIRRGVVFVKEIVPRRTIAWVARALYNENYVALPMRHEVKLPDPATHGDGLVTYEWRFLDRWNSIRVRVESPAVLPAEGSEEEFITERYWGYSLQRDLSTVEFQVAHPKWRVWRAVSAELDCNVSRLYGLEFAQFLSGSPSSAFVADGSLVIVRRKTRLT